MIRIGLTGSIGMGKSAVSAMFRQLGVPVFDADAEVHHLQGPSGALVGLIEARFPGSTGPKGVDRAKLGPMVLGKVAELKALERIIHPAVAKSRHAFLRRHRAKAMVVLDIPLLFEKAKPLHPIKAADTVVVVSAPPWVQARRVLRRQGMTHAKLKQILTLQMPDHIKRAKADVVIDTGCLRIETYHAVRRLVTCIKAAKRR